MLVMLDINDMDDGPHIVVLLEPDQADELGTQVRDFAAEVRQNTG
jgi:hypothetical protein